MGISVQYLALSLVLALLVYVELSTSKPVLEEAPGSLTNSNDKNEVDSSYDPIEEARQLWNGAKRLQRSLRPRRKRSVSASVPPANNELPANLNISGPKYILDLYRNLTRNPAMQQTTQANTIRSLQTSENIGRCSLFEWNLL